MGPFGEPEAGRLQHGSGFRTAFHAGPYGVRHERSRLRMAVQIIEYVVGKTHGNPPNVEGERSNGGPMSFCRDNTT